MTGPALVLIGPMGAGKSSLGRKVAKTLRVPFVDTDVLITRAHGAIPELFAERGEAGFRALERDAVARALNGDGVVALGGGAVLHADTHAELRGHRVALLTIAPERVAARIAGDKRPLLAGEDPVARWHAIYDERRAVYEELADAVFDTSAGTMSQIAGRIAAWTRGETDE